MPVNNANIVASMSFPVLAFTPNGVMPYSSYENLLRVMKHEYDMQWYENLEVVDTKGTCVVVSSARIVRQPKFAKILGGMVEVEIDGAAKVADYDVDAFRSRVLEFLSIYPDMYQSAGIYNQLIKQVEMAATPTAIVWAFLE